MKISKLLYLFALETSQTNITVKAAKKFIEKMNVEDMLIKNKTKKTINN